MIRAFETRACHQVPNTRETMNDNKRFCDILKQCHHEDAEKWEMISVADLIKR